MIDKLIKVATPQIGKQEISAVQQVLLSGRYVSGSVVKKLENTFAQYVGVKHCAVVNSGTAALHTALAAMEIQPGEEIIVPSLTFFATVNAVIHQGGVPIFADIHPDNYCLDPEDIERCLSKRTRAIIPVHYFGHAAEMDAIMEIARNNNLAVIEDCAQAHGTLYKGQMVGSIGDIGAFSFFATKHMTTGEGGAITTNNKEWADRARLIRSHGLEGRDDHVLLGYNYRMSEMAAAIGVEQLKKLPELNRCRIENSLCLIDKIRNIPWLKVPIIPDYVKHTFFWCHVEIDEDLLGMTTRELVGELREKGIETRNRYWEPLYRQSLMTNNIPAILRVVAGQNLPDYASLHLPNVEKIAGKIIGLPNRPDITKKEIDQVAEILHSIG